MNTLDRILILVSAIVILFVAITVRHTNFNSAVVLFALGIACLACGIFAPKP